VEGGRAAESFCLRGLVFSNQVLLLYCCFTAALLLQRAFVCGGWCLQKNGDSHTSALLLLYCCFTAALLLLRALCFPIRLCTEKWRLAYLLLLYCCFTAALLLLYRCFTAAESFFFADCAQKNGDSDTACDGWGRADNSLARGVCDTKHSVYLLYWYNSSTHPLATDGEGVTILLLAVRSLLDLLVQKYKY
jgi:hypothetical protein